MLLQIRGPLEVPTLNPKRFRERSVAVLCFHLGSCQPSADLSLSTFYQEGKPVPQPKEHQSSPLSTLSLCLALAKSRQLLSGSARWSWVVCPRDGVPSSHTTRRSLLNGSDRHIILPALSNDRSREASNIHAPATNYGGGMDVFGLRDVSVCHDGPYRHCCLHTRPAASAGGEKGLLAKGVPPVRTGRAHRDPWSFPLARRPATGNDH